MGPAFSEGGALLISAFPRASSLALMGLALVQMPVQAQNPTWNHPRVLQMIQEARDLRQGRVEESGLQSYSSNARGYVYFYLDREDTGERILVKTDQIALEVFWKAPNQIKQRIVGLRDEKSLPTNIHYHLDHLVVVQDEFGDRIRIGDGDEVEAVVHPVAPGSETMYDFLLADSVTLNLTSTSDTIRVFEIQVRPKDFEAPGFVGAVFLDRATKAIVRMSFTFTPSSYVDPYLDHISISLENGLWLGQYWLPFRQQLEIRREVPYLDIPAGSVIRGSFEVGDYEINPLLPPSLFLGRTISALPQEERIAFPFEDSLHAQLDEEGLSGLRPPPEMGEIRSLALSVAKDRYLSGLRRLRLFLPQPSFSSALRFNRAEGVFLGAGVSYTLSPQIGTSSYGGYAFGRGRPTLEGKISGGERRPSSTFEVFLNRPHDLGPVSAISGALNTLGAAIFQEDFTDLYFATGASITHTLHLSTESSIKVTARREEHRSARDVVSSDPQDTDFRGVQPIDEGLWVSLDATASVQTEWPGLNISMGGEAARFHDQDFGFLSVDLDYRRRWHTRGMEIAAEGKGGALLGTPPIQAHFFLGGRRTVAGYPFRSRTGDAFWLLRSEVALDVAHPFLRVRGFAAAGGVREEAVGESNLRGPSARWSRLLSVGLGVGLGWDIIRLDLARGLRGGGEWEFMVGVRQDFWPWL